MANVTALYAWGTPMQSGPYPLTDWNTIKSPGMAFRNIPFFSHSVANVRLGFL